MVTSKYYEENIWIPVQHYHMNINLMLEIWNTAAEF